LGGIRKYGATQLLEVVRRSGGDRGHSLVGTGGGAEALQLGREPADE
jgi:hypothetical protein